MVERDINRTVGPDLAEIGFDALRGQAVVVGGDDGHRPGSGLEAVLAGPDRLGGRPLRRSGDNRHPPRGRLTDDLDDLPPLLDGEAEELTGRAVGIEAMDAPVDEPLHVPEQLLLVDPPLGIQRHHVGNEDAGDRGGVAGGGHARACSWERGWGPQAYTHLPPPGHLR